LALDDLTPLMDILYDEGCVKVLHSGRQDMELFFDRYGKLPKPLFDTQVAAALLGYGNQVGYGALVKEMAGVELDKAHSRTDWARRPLDQGQISYAADDVRYLLDIYEKQQARLDALGRIEWLKSDFEQLVDVNLYQRGDRDSWQRLRGVNRLKGAQLAVLRELSDWREQQARSRNKPRKWVLADEVMLDIARFSPKDSEKLGRVRGLSEATVKRDSDELLALVAKGLNLPKDEWPLLPKRVGLSENQESIVDLLMSVSRYCAQQSNVSIASLVTRKELERLVAGERDLPILQGWRGAIAGEQLLAVLEGDATVMIENGELMMLDLES
jgi:ribonuclease D